jgi:hypothetical protein
LISILSQTMHRFVPAIVLSLLAFTNALHAEEIRYYDVEVIIFESLDPSARQSENWKTDINREIPPVAAELDQPYPGPIPPQYDPSLTFKTLPQNRFQLQPEEKLLTNTNQYRILLHTAWIQPGMDPTAALPVHINRTFLTDTPVSHTLTPSSPGMPPANLPPPAGATQTRSVLDGYIKIILTRYLQADVDLVYKTDLPLSDQTMLTSPATNAGASTLPSATTAIPMTQPVIYRLTESRRMRSKELHYLDHPVLGVLLLITPYEGKVAPQKQTPR